MREKNWEMIQAQNCHFQDSIEDIFSQQASVEAPQSPKWKILSKQNQNSNF